MTLSGSSDSCNQVVWESATQKLSEVRILDSPVTTWLTLELEVSLSTIQMFLLLLGRTVTVCSTFQIGSSVVVVYLLRTVVQTAANTAPLLARAMLFQPL